MSADFALNLIRETGLEKSAAISPLSISFALGMTLLGTKGNTAKEIQDAIAAKGVDSDVIHTHFLNMYNFIKNHDSLKMANKIYFEQGMTVFDSYKEQIQKFYDGNFQQTDFSDSQKAIDEINEFVAESTNGEIQNIIDWLHPNVKMILVNALYFDKKWEMAFKTYPYKTPFYSFPDVTKNITMMSNEGYYNYVRKENYQFLEIPYMDHIFSMFIVLPNERFGLSEVLKTFNVYEFLDLMFTNNSVEGTVVIPKFEAESSFELSKVLQKLNITDAFDGMKADFSGTTDMQIFISRVLHKVSVKVSEKGTIAAAVTIVEDELISYDEPLLNFEADHPFLYVSADKGKNVYFMGTFFG